MTPEPGLERTYSYCGGWRVACCSALFLGIPGVVGAALVPFGCQQVRNGPLPLGIALVVIGVFTVPLIMFAILSLAFGVRDAISPPLLRVRPSSLILPSALREFTTVEEQENRAGSEHRKSTPLPAHPEEIPFATIRRVRREGGNAPTNNRLMIVYALIDRTLVIEQSMMQPADFDELETVLRTAIPSAFAPAPPPL
jgi:hypothetical protein